MTSERVLICGGGREFDEAEGLVDDGEGIIFHGKAFGVFFRFKIEKIGAAKVDEREVFDFGRYQ